MKRFLPAMLVAATVFACNQTASASINVGATISNDGILVDNDLWNLGYSFNVVSAVNVVSLGVWDHLGDGLINSHQVGLWDSLGNLLASTTVGSGVAGILDSGFRFNDIGPVSLTVGNTYYVAATFSGPGDDYWTADPTSLVMAPEITYDSRRYQSGNVLVFPDLAGSNTTGYWGGNIRLSNDAIVPEPGAIAIWSIFGLAGLGFRRRKVVQE